MMAGRSSPKHYSLAAAGTTDAGPCGIAQAFGRSGVKAAIQASRRATARLIGLLLHSYAKTASASYRDNHAALSLITLLTFVTYSHRPFDKIFFPHLRSL